MKQLLVFLMAVLVVSVVCEDDTVAPPEPKPLYANLTQRSHVLNNLEVAYNQQHISRYQEVLDENFTFFFYSGDVGGDVPAQWDRVEEMAASTHLFDKAYVDTDLSDGIQQACKKIKMDVTWEDGLQWQEVPQGSETWYSTVVFYNFQFDIGENDHFINSPGSKAQFTVRNAGTADDPHWQLVEMHDLDQGLLAASSAVTEQTTWGQVKALYR